MIDYEEEWVVSLPFRIAGSSFFKAACFAIPPTLVTILLLILQDNSPDFRKKYHLDNLSSSSIWNAFAAGLVLMIGFRTNRAISRFWEGTGLLHQMRGEWFDTVSNCVSFTVISTKDKPKEVMEFRHTLVRLMSLAHGYALEEISGNIFELETIDVMGIDKATLRYFKAGHEECKFNKVEMCLHLIQTLITTAFHQDTIRIPPPIMSRVYQTISRGFVNLLNTKKITDTKFPFPYAQMIAFALIMFGFITPVIFSSFLEHKGVAAIATFTPVFVLAGLNYTAAELENPFGKDDNDLPLKHFQWEMDNCLLMLLHPSADHVPTISGDAVLDFNVLLEDFKRQDEFEDGTELEATQTQSNESSGKTSQRRFNTAYLARTSSQQQIFRSSSLRTSGEKRSRFSLITPATVDPLITPSTETLDVTEVPASQPLPGPQPLNGPNHEKTEASSIDGNMSAVTSEEPPYFSIRSDVAPGRFQDTVIGKTGSAQRGSDVTVTVPPSAAEVADNLQTLVERGMCEFVASLESWTQTLVAQNQDLSKQYVSHLQHLKNFSKLEDGLKKSGLETKRLFGECDDVML